MPLVQPHVLCQALRKWMFNRDLLELKKLQNAQKAEKETVRHALEALHMQMHGELKAERPELEKVTSVSPHSLTIEQKLPALAPSFPITAIPSREDHLEDHRRNESAIKGAGTSTARKDDRFSSTTPHSQRFGRGAPDQSVYYHGPTSAKEFSFNDSFTGYAAKPKDEDNLSHDDDSHDDEGRPLAVWCLVQRDIHGRPTSKPDLFTFHREAMIPFDTRDPPARVGRNTTGRTRISRDFHCSSTRAHNLAKSDPASDLGPASHKAPHSRLRRKSGQKYLAERSRDYERRLARSQSEDDIFPYYSPQVNDNTSNTGNNGKSDSSASPSSSSGSKTRPAYAAQMDRKRRPRQRSGRRKARLPGYDSDDYTKLLRKDLTVHSRRNPRRSSQASAKIFSSWWKDNVTKWPGPIYDSEYPFNVWEQDCGRLLDANSPYLESVPTEPQQRAWFWDTCGLQFRQDRHSIIQNGERAHVLRIRNGSPLYSAI